MIFFDDESVKIGGVILPGIYKSMEVNHEAQIDEQQVEGTSRRPKQAVGYDDAKIVIEISLMDSERMTKEDKLLIIQNMFKAENQEKPAVHEMVSAHGSIRGINKVIIRNMTSKEKNTKDEITVSLELLQYDTMTIQASKKGTGGNSRTESSDSLSEEYKQYLSNDRGQAPKQTGKTSNTPAVDSSHRRISGVQQ